MIQKVEYGTPNNKLTLKRVLGTNAKAQLNDGNGLSNCQSTGISAVDAYDFCPSMERNAMASEELSGTSALGLYVCVLHF